MPFYFQNGLIRQRLRACLNLFGQGRRKKLFLFTLGHLGDYAAELAVTNGSKAELVLFIFLIFIGW